MIRYGVEKAEAIRSAQGMDREQFSIAIGFASRAYPFAVERGTLTYRMAFSISQRFHVKLGDLGPLDGGTRRSRERRRHP